MAANEEAFPVQINDPKHPLNKWKTVVRNVQNPHGGPPIVQSETVPVCNYCHKDEDELGLKLQICSRCHKARYCCRQHQKKDWKSHKAICQVRSLDDYMDPPFAFSFTDEDFVLKKMGSKEELDLIGDLSKKAGKYRKAKLQALKLDNRFHTAMNKFIYSDEFPPGTMRFLGGFGVIRCAPGNAIINSAAHFMPTAFLQG